MSKNVITFLGSERCGLDTVLPGIEALSAQAANGVRAAISAHKINIRETEFVRKAYKDPSPEPRPKERAIRHLVTTGMVDLEGDVLLQSGGIRDYYGNQVLYVHDYTGKFLPIGKCMGMEVAPGSIRARTVFAKHDLAEDLYHLYCDDVDGTGPICRDWSVGFIPLRVAPRGGKGWKEALALALKARPDLAEREDAIARIVLSWILLEYSATPIGVNPEARSTIEEKGLIHFPELKVQFKGLFAGMKAEETPAPDAPKPAPAVPPAAPEPPPAPPAPAPETPAPEPEKAPETPAPAPKPAEDPAPAAAPVPIETKPEEKDEPKRAETDPANAGGNAGGEGPGASGDGEANAAGEGVSQPVKPAEDAGKEAVFKVTAPDPQTIKIAAPAASTPPATPAPASSTPPPAPQTKSLTDRQAAMKAKLGAEGKGLQEAYKYFSDSLPIFWPIDENMSVRVVDYLLAQNLIDGEKEITLIINSPGGFCTDGFAIIDAMEFISNPIRTVAFGQISSMGLMIFMAGDNRVISPNCSVLSHRFWGCACGSQAEMEAQTVEHENLHKRIVAHYAKYSKFDDQEDIEANLLREVDTYLTPKQAVKFGLADEILSPDFKFVEPMVVEGEEDEIKATAGKSMKAADRKAEEDDLLFSCAVCGYAVMGNRDNPELKTAGGAVSAPDCPECKVPMILCEEEAPAPSATVSVKVTSELGQFARSLDAISTRLAEITGGPLARPEVRAAITDAMEKMELALESLGDLCDVSDGKKKPKPCEHDHAHAAAAPAPEAEHKREVPPSAPEAAKPPAPVAPPARTEAPASPAPATLTIRHEEIGPDAIRREVTAAIGAIDIPAMVRQAAQAAIDKARGRISPRR